LAHYISLPPVDLSPLAVVHPVCSVGEEMYDKTLEQIMQEARKGNEAAKLARRLLSDLRFKK